MLEIKNLKASIQENIILNGVNLNIKKGEIHAIMGTNGSGKSTFSKILAGHPSYALNDGEIIFNNENINTKSPEERAELGLFLAFQYPVEIPGVSNEEFLRIAYNIKRKNNSLKEISPIEFLTLINNKLDISIYIKVKQSKQKQKKEAEEGSRRRKQKKRQIK